MNCQDWNLDIVLLSLKIIKENLISHEDLRNDADFKKRASELLIKIKNQGYSFAEEIGEKIEFLDHPHNSEHDADKHDLSEIEGAIKDRKTGDINKVIEEISTEMEKAKSSER